MRFRARGILDFVFFGNYFYGLCALALAFSASVQLGYQPVPVNFYLLLFFATVWYYNLAFSTIDQKGGEQNIRLQWHKAHQSANQRMQWVLFALILFLFFKLFVSWAKADARPEVPEILLLVFFPLLAFLYYGINTGKSGMLNLRRIGWLKPFLIALVWTGVSAIVPGIIAAFEKGLSYSMEGSELLFLTEHFIFITVLSIMFDIKDYATDHSLALRTIVVKWGLRRTIYLVLLPMLLLGYLFMLLFVTAQNGSGISLFLNSLPYGYVSLLALALQKRKSIYFYLVLIDGGMLIKAACGILATFLTS